MYVQLTVDFCTLSSLTCRGLLGSKVMPVVKGRGCNRNPVEGLSQGLLSITETLDVDNPSAGQQIEFPLVPAHCYRQSRRPEVSTSSGTTPSAAEPAGGVGHFSTPGRVA